MGAFFTSVHVLGSATATPEAVARAIVEQAEGAQLLPSADGDDSGPVDRTVVLTRGPRWIGVYDQATEGQELEGLDRLAAGLSSAVGSAAVVVRVHDSDVVLLRLFDGGERLDTFDSDPSYGGEAPSAEALAEATGRPDRWAGVLAKGHTPAELADVFSDESCFAEDTARAVAVLLGADPAAMSVGYRYLLEAPLPPDAITLRLRRRERPWWETPAEGPPSFTSQGRSVAQPLAVGERLSAGVQALNGGGPAHGLVVRVFGPALAEGLVEVDQAWLTVGQRRPRLGEVELKRVDGPEGPELRAELPDEVVPAGMQGSLTTSTTPEDRNQAFMFMQRSQVTFALAGRVVRVGEGSLVTRVEPIADPALGAEDRARIIGIPPVARPLRAAADASSAMLNILVEDSCVVGLVVFDAPRAAVVDGVRATFEALVERVGLAADYDLMAFGQDPHRKPSTQPVAGGELLGSQAWAKLRERMIEDRHVCFGTPANLGGLRPGAERELHRGGHGLLFGTSVLASPLEDDVELTAACWWVDVSDRDDASIHAALETIAGAIDDAVAGGTAVQGMLSRWVRPPLMMVDHTPYEDVCQTSGPPNTCKSYLTRWLRAVGTESTWLGAPLVAHLPTDGLDALRASCEVTPRGEGLRLRLAEREGIAELERALAPILPSAEDHRRASLPLRAAARRQLGLDPDG